MKLYTLTIIASLCFVGCKNNSNTAETYTYFGGEIINPKNNHITLSNPETGTDTITLDQHNRFYTKITNVKPGIYSFTHGGEHQLVLLEDHDSLFLRLNTIDFDESLVFTGIGSKKNNYLIKTFLENETENNNIKTLCLLEPEALEVYLDSSKIAKQKDLNKFLERKPSSELFKSIAEVNINYNNYYYKEAYPFFYFGNTKLVHYKDLPEGFYNYRKNINYNLDYLNEYGIYNRFLFAHFNNLALKEYYQNAKHHHIVFNRQSLKYNLAKLKLIDSLVSDTTIKDYLLKHTTKDFIYNSRNKVQTNLVYKSYLKKSKNKQDIAEINDLLEKLSNLEPGKHIPNVMLTNYKGEQTEVRSLITKPTILFFWSSNYELINRNSHHRAKKLKAKYPNIDFISININDNDNAYWKRKLKRSKFATENEFQFKNMHESIDVLAINSVYTVILVDENNKIISSNSSMFSPEFERQIQFLTR
ncbi:TlpA family protein disulfide reductase [Lacinutrix undariae]